MLRLIGAFSLLSLIAMIVIDRSMGSRAEFLNAWSVLERLLGRAPSAGQSLVAARMGAVGELLAVLVANAAIGTVLAAAVRLARKLLG
jgi:hypothetical protein